MSDAGGNNERLVFIFDGRKLERLDEIGEIAYPPSRAATVRMKGVRRQFSGFDRSPYLASFQLTGTALSVQLVNVHLFYGSDTRADLDRRALESLAVARWTALRNRSKYAGARELIALGDFNMPKPRRDGTNPVQGALASGGLVIPPHSSTVRSSIASDNCYDQVAMFPATTEAWLVNVGVFDFDSVVFRDLWTGFSRSTRSPAPSAVDRCGSSPSSPIPPGSPGSSPTGPGPGTHPSGRGVRRRDDGPPRGSRPVTPTGRPGPPGSGAMGVPGCPGDGDPPSPAGLAGMRADRTGPGHHRPPAWGRELTPGAPFPYLREEKGNSYSFKGNSYS